VKIISADLETLSFKLFDSAQNPICCISLCMRCDKNIGIYLNSSNECGGDSDNLMCQRLKFIKISIVRTLITKSNSDNLNALKNFSVISPKADGGVEAVTSLSK